MELGCSVRRVSGKSSSPLDLQCLSSAQKEEKIRSHTDALPCDLIQAIMRKVPPGPKLLACGLVSSRWHRCWCQSTAHVALRTGAKLQEEQLLCSVEHLLGLTSLTLPRDSLAEQSPDFLPALSTTCPNLLHLSIRLGKKSEHLSSSNLIMPKLLTLVLQCQAVPAWVSSLGSLRHLELEDCQDLPEGFGNGLASLRILRISTAILHSFPASSSAMSNLRSLTLNLHASPQLPRNLGLLWSLKNLRVICPCIKTSTALDASGIWSMSHMRHLSLSLSSHLGAMPSGIGLLISLQRLEIRCGSPGEYPRCTLLIPDSLWQLKGLRHISLQGLSGDTSLAGIGQSVGLRTVTIANCGFRSLPRGLEHRVVEERERDAVRGLGAFENMINPAPKTFRIRRRSNFLPLKEADLNQEAALHIRCSHGLFKNATLHFC